MIKDKTLHDALDLALAKIKRESGTEIGNSLEFDFVVPASFSMHPTASRTINTRSMNRLDYT